MEILRELKRMGKTIFISSHILSELAELCDSVTIIDRGMVRFSGPMDALLQADDEEPAFTLQLASPVEDAVDRLQNIPAVISVEIPEHGDGSELHVTTQSGTETNVLMAAVAELDLPLSSFSKRRKQLNQAFMDLTTRGVRT